MAERGRNRFDSNFKEELKREIKQELLEELRGSPSRERIVFVKEKLHEPESKKPIKLLIVLVLVVLILDFAIVFFYYNPSFFKTSGFVIKTTNSNEVSGGCSDGTNENTCSKTKPYYCTNGKLVEAGYTCGCPAGFVREFQSCKSNS